MTDERIERLRIGYFIPEFPSQTHIIFWRELHALGTLGVDSKIISSRRPNEKLMTHEWSVDAARITEYLYPLSTRDIAQAVGLISLSGPRSWLRCLAVIRAAEVPFDEKLRLARLIPFAAKLVGLARRQSLPHIHVGSCGNIANVAMFARLLGGPSYSLSLLGPRLDTYGPNQRQKWKYAAFGLFQSEQLYAEAQDRIGPNLPSQIDVAPIGVNVDVMKRSDAYVPWSGTGTCRIYCCARLNPIKGHIYLIEAVKRLRELLKIDARLILAGEDESGGQSYRKTIETVIREADMTEYVTLLGAISEEANHRQYARAHIYAMASLDEAAGAVAAMEAMAMELPVIMTDAGATRELIEDGVDARIVPLRDPAALASAMAEILTDSALAHRLSKGGRAKIVAKFNHWRSAEKIKEFLSR